MAGLRSKLNLVVGAATKDGSAVVVLPTDHLIWSERVAGVLTDLDQELGSDASVTRELWLLGDLSATVQREIESANWKVYTRVRPKLIPNQN